ncbi:MAG: DNA repair protein RecO [Candidatus Peribacteraceae bacterium]|jgi:DNA repair protein RecO|nr:DNA repair protein RecO [bacterium]MDP6561586.1 DNA repair protein RecO [Candidatus Peribacteraceae bacterium]|tara:strand:- start:10163 stop:10813 length:651 start_codon:yes stop_codon:yes gene_type:complete
MGKTISLEAIILQVHDVGESDRFCILFTKERGKIAARARSVRKPSSKMGGSLLPLQHVKLQLREGSAGFMISDVQKISAFDNKDVTAFLNAQQGMELLLTTLHDEECMENLFEATLKFLELCSHSTGNVVLPFTIQLLKIMGLLPDADNAYFQHCSDTQKQYLKFAAKGAWQELPELSANERTIFSGLCAELLSEISSRPLKAGTVINDVRNACAL